MTKQELLRLVRDMLLSGKNDQVNDAAYRGSAADVSRVEWDVNLATKVVLELLRRTPEETLTELTNEVQS